MELSNRPCPRCGQSSFFKNNHSVGLPVYDSMIDGKLQLSSTIAFPVRPYFCKVCKYVEFSYEHPEEL